MSIIDYGGNIYELDRELQFHIADCDS